MLTKKTKFTIGRLAHVAGVNIETVRYYQKIGLLQQPEKPKLGGFRTYSESDVWRIRLIKRAQELEFTLAEIARLIDLVESGDCDSLRREAAAKIAAIDTQIDALASSRTQLVKMIERCSVGGRDDCAFIDWLAHGDDATAAQDGHP